jgi:hypothetical protein
MYDQIGPNHDVGTRAQRQCFNGLLASEGADTSVLNWLAAATYLFNQGLQAQAVGVDESVWGSCALRGCAQ